MKLKILSSAGEILLEMDAAAAEFLGR